MTSTDGNSRVEGNSRRRGWRRATMLVLAAPFLAMCTDATSAANVDDGEVAGSLVAASQAVTVSGSAVHHFTTAIVHSAVPTDAGMIQRSTDIIALSGDLNGYILYHPTSIFDFANGTLVNTGTQLFSGTIAGSDPVILHDDSFRFDVDLSSGETVGQVHLRRSKDAPHRGGWFECDLVIVGSGTMTPDGDAMVDYSGECTRRGNPR
jgi:hypothetical protein